MKDRDRPVPRKLKALVIDALRRHAWNIGVSQFKGDVFYMAEDKDDGEGDLMHAQMVVDRRYLHATLQIYPAAIRDWQRQGDKYVEQLVAHEVAHIATQHIYDVGTATYREEGEMKDAWETLTEVIGRLSVALDKAKRKR